MNISVKQTTHQGTTDAAARWDTEADFITELTGGKLARLPADATSGFIRVPVTATYALKQAGKASADLGSGALGPTRDHAALGLTDLIDAHITKPSNSASGGPRRAPTKPTRYAASRHSSSASGSPPSAPGLPITPRCWPGGAGVTGFRLANLELYNWCTFGGWV